MIGIISKIKKIFMPNIFRVCPVCRNFDRSKITRIGDLKPTFNFSKNKIPVFELVECGICKTIYQTPLPSDAVFHELYVDTVQFTSDAYVGERSKAVVEYFTSCAHNMMNKMGKSSGVKVLEIGSGLSWMCNAVKGIDAQSYTVAQDITPECVNICKWVDNYIVGSTEDNYGAIKKMGPYDIISLTHVIEHLSYPVDFLIQLAPLLSPKGIIFITAPYQAPGWKNANNDIRFWQKWSYNHVPGHLQYLSENSVKAISAITNLKILSYDNNHDGGSAFELMLGLPDQSE
jgi:methyltransferase family protein